MVDRRFPLGLHARAGSRPGRDSEVADSLGWKPAEASRAYILTWRLAWSDPDPSGWYGSRDETAKKEASPRKEMTGRPWSFGWATEGAVSVGWRAADLPSEPWNWVDLDPHPTLMNLSARCQWWVAG